MYVNATEEMNSLASLCTKYYLTIDEIEISLFNFLALCFDYDQRQHSHFMCFTCIMLFSIQKDGALPFSQLKCDLKLRKRLNDKAVLFSQLSRPFS